MVEALNEKPKNLSKELEAEKDHENKEQEKSKAAEKKQKDRENKAEKQNEDNIENRKEAKQAQGRAFPGHGNPKQTEEQKEIAKLKKDLRDTQMERDILKKAVSIFSKSDGKYSNS